MPARADARGAVRGGSADIAVRARRRADGSRVGRHVRRDVGRHVRRDVGRNVGGHVRRHLWRDVSVAVVRHGSVDAAFVPGAVEGGVGARRVEDVVVVGASGEEQRTRSRDPRGSIGSHSAPRNPTKLGDTTRDVPPPAGASDLPPRLTAKSVAPATTPPIPTARPTLATVCCVLPFEMSLALLGGQTLPGQALWSPPNVELSIAPKMAKTANPATPTPPRT